MLTGIGVLKTYPFNILNARISQVLCWHLLTEFNILRNIRFTETWIDSEEISYASCALIPCFTIRFKPDGTFVTLWPHLPWDLQLSLCLQQQWVAIWESWGHFWWYIWYEKRYSSDRWCWKPDKILSNFSYMFLSTLDRNGFFILEHRSSQDSYNYSFHWPHHAHIERKLFLQVITTSSLSTQNKIIPVYSSCSI